LFVLGAVDDEPSLAAVAPDGAFEVVVVIALTDADGSAGVEHGLDAVEDFPGD
jgi:hypothetical protein